MHPNSKQIILLNIKHSDIYLYGEKRETLPLVVGMLLTNRMIHKRKNWSVLL